MVAATLVGAGPASDADPLCGTTITDDLTLNADLDCTGVAGSALTVGADGVTVEGQGYRILAPDASTGIVVSAARWAATK